MNLKLLTGVLAAAVVWLGSGASAQAAKAVHVDCGDTITADTRLANDLLDCPGIGVVIGADDITLDLNGHTIDGDGLADVEGVSNIGHDGVAIEGGSIRDFVEGVAVLFAADNSVRDLSLSHLRHVGVFVSGSTNIRVAKTSSVDVAFSGIFVTRSQDIDVERNVVRQSGGGIAARLSNRVRITDNIASDNENEGILLFDDSAEADIERNAASGNAAGIVVAADRNVLRHNRVFANGDNIVLDGGSDNVVSANRVLDALGFPDDPESGFGILVIGGDHNRLEGNRVERAAHDGILVESSAADTLLERNTADDNGDDGIDVDNAATTLAGNTTDRNGDLGIEAVPGVTDGGNNRARGNGNPLQCSNVSCR
jgi:parallel beta-helix repeat protein